MWKQIIFLILNILLYNNAPSTMSRTFIGIVLVVALVSIICYYREKKDRINNLLFRHSILFVLFFSIISYQFYIDYVISFIDQHETKIWVDTSIVCKSVCLCNVALSTFFIGYFIKKKEYCTENKSHIDIINISYAKKLCYISLLLLLYFVLNADSGTFNGAYVENTGTVDSNYFIIVVIQALLLSIFSIYILNYKSLSTPTNIIRYFSLPVVIVILYVIIVILTGRRTEAIRVFLILLGAVSLSKGRDLNYKRIFLVCMVAAVIFSLVGVLRQDEGMSVSEGLDTLNDKMSIMPLTAEFAGSIMPLHVALSSIPHSIGYTYGTTLIIPFSLLVPGLDRYLHSLGLAATSMQSGSLLTYLYFGLNAPYGIGSNIVADAYVAFGLLGVVLCFCFLGYFFRFIEIKSLSLNSYYITALSLCCLSQIPYACRTGFSVFFLSWTYSCVILFVLMKFSKR